MARLLIYHGIDVNALTHNDSTPLYTTISQGQESNVHLLIIKGADVDREMANIYSPEPSRTPLIFAVSHGQ